MSKAITTTFHGPTNTRGSRYSAKDSDGNRVTVPADHALRVEDNHKRAALALCAKMQWQGAETLIAGGLANGYVFVFPDASIIRTGTRYRVRFVYDPDASFEESNGEARPLTEQEYKGNEYRGCPVHPRKPLKAHGTCSVADCRRKAQDIPYDEYLAYYGNPERHVYLGCIVDRACPCCDEWSTAGSLWSIDFMDDDRALHAITIGNMEYGSRSAKGEYLTEEQAIALPSYLGEVAREVLDDAKHDALKAAGNAR
jgi:hypothetical protein